MGFYRPLIDRAQGLKKPGGPEPSDNIITPATIMTGTRIPLALKAAEKLLTGQKLASPYVLAMAVSDAEGNVARAMDILFPELRRGRTKKGAEWDVAADAIGVMIVAGAVLFAPRVTKTAKLAVATTMGQEAFKTGRYLMSNMEYLQTQRDYGLDPERLVIPVDKDGQEAMFEKFLAVTFASMTNDVDNRYARMGFSALTVAHAIPSTIRAERARRNSYVPQIDASFAALHEQYGAATPALVTQSYD